jgi:trehalose 6-phosphate phosphatase
MRRPMTLPPPPAELLTGASLFLDLDGTLVEFADSPSGIAVCDQLRALLLDLQHRLDGRVAVISGRGLADLAGHLDLPDFPIAGSHGAERRLADGQVEECEIPACVSHATLEASEFAANHQLITEAKPMGVAVHFRNQPGIEPAVDDFAADAAARHGLVVQKGAMVRELRAPGRNKGDVVKLYMSEAPFNAGRPVMVGDDVTDEDAFGVVNDLGGASILVGSERDTLAHYALPDVTAVKQWLAGR